MKTTYLITAALAAVVTLGALPVHAQPTGKSREDIVRAGKSHDVRRDTHNRRIEVERERERNLEQHEYYNARTPAFRPGLRIPPMFLHPSYVIVDHRLHRLPPPPRGHEWVQVGPDYVLVAIGTGVIVQIVLGF